MYNADGTDLSSRAQKLVCSVEQLTAAVAEMRTDNAVARRRSRHNRIMIILTTAGLLLDLVLSAVLLDQHRTQDCLNRAQAQRNATTTKFLKAEVAKVSGQVAGLNKITTDPAAGIAQFRQASENYLAYVSKRQQQSTPTC